MTTRFDDTISIDLAAAILFGPRPGSMGLDEAAHAKAEPLPACAGLCRNQADIHLGRPPVSDVPFARL